jgi:hypothetical protein
MFVVNAAFRDLRNESRQWNQASKIQANQIPEFRIEDPWFKRNLKKTFYQLHLVTTCFVLIGTLIKFITGEKIKLQSVTSTFH